MQVVRPLVRHIAGCCCTVVVVRSTPRSLVASSLAWLYCIDCDDVGERPSICLVLVLKRQQVQGRNLQKYCKDYKSDEDEDSSEDPTSLSVPCRIAVVVIRVAASVNWILLEDAD